MWEAARRFSADEAYPESDFPVTDEDAKCLLCQQELRGASPDRLKRFEEFISSTLQQQLDQARSRYASLYQVIETLTVRDDTTNSSIEELRIDSEQLAAAVDAGIRQADELRAQVLRTLAEGDASPGALPELVLDAEAVTEQANALRQRADELVKNTGLEVKKQLSKELRELEDRSTLGEKPRGRPQRNRTEETTGGLRTVS